MKRLWAQGAIVLMVVAEAVMLTTPARAVSNVAPDPADQSGGNYHHVVSKTGHVNIQRTYSKVFFRDNTRHEIIIEDANLCNNGKDEGATRQSGAPHTRFEVFGARANTQIKNESDANTIDTVFGEKDLSGGCGSKTLVIPANSLIQTDSKKFQERRYVAILKASWASASYNTQNSFKYRVEAGALVGMYGTVGTVTTSRDSGIQATGPDTYENIQIPLRPPCNVTDWASITIYDPDNGVGGIQPTPFRVKVRKVGSGDLPASQYRPGARWSGNASIGYAPGSGSRDEYALGVRWEKGERYVVELNGVWGNNTLQVGVPWDSVPFELNCPKNTAPEGNIISAVCPANQENAQRIRFRVSDVDGPTVGYIKVSTWQSRNYSSDDNPNDTGDFQGGSRGLDFGENQYRVRLFVRDEKPDGENGGFVKVDDTVMTQLCTESGDVIGPRVRGSTDIEVGGTVTGRSGYRNTFVMPTDPKREHGYDTRRYDSPPYIAYVARMWLDNGDETYTAGVDEEIGKREITSDAKERIGSGTQWVDEWSRSGVRLEPPNDPRYKVCTSMQVTRAWYRYQDATLDYYDEPPYDHDNDPDTPDYDPSGYWYISSWSDWIEKDIDGTNKTMLVRCSRIVKWPSLSVDDGDVKTGSVFAQGGATACNPYGDATRYGVIGHQHDVEPAQRGSRAEYAVVASGPITGFGSNDSLPADATGTIVLNFANIGGNGYYYGSSDVATTNCFPDVFGSYPGDSVSPSEAGGASVSATSNGQSHYNFSGSDGTMTINSGQLSAGTKRVIRVTQTGENNTVVITGGGITFAAGPYANISAIPQFVLLIDGEIDIKVASSVTRLDGIYVTRGNFHTCNEFDSTTWNINLDSGSPCRNQLTINGSVMVGGSLEPYRTNADDTTYREPAEILKVRGDVLISDYAQKRRSGNLNSVGELELPPRF